MTDWLHGFMTWIDPTRVDFFQFFRAMLAVACGIYALVVMARSLWSWALYLSGPERTTVLLRRYVLIQFLRLRWRPFVAESMQIVFWGGLLVVLLRMHA